MPDDKSTQDRESQQTNVRIESAIVGDVAITPSHAPRTMLRLVRELFVYDPRGTLLAVALSVAVTFTSGVGLVMLVPLLGVAGLDVEAGSIGQLAQVATRALTALGLELTMPTVIAVFLVVVTVGAALQRLHAVRTARLYHGYVVTVRRRVHAAITHCGWAHYVRRPGSSFVHVLTQEIERLGGATSGLIGLGVSTLLMLIYVGLALFLSPPTTLMVIVCGAALLGVLARSTRLGRAKGEAVSSSYAALHRAIAEHLAGMRVSKSHGLEPFHLERFGERTIRTEDAQVDMVRNRSAVAFWMQVGSATIMAGVFVVSLHVLALPLASILLMLFLFSRLVPMLSGLQRTFQQVLNMLPSVDRVERMRDALESMAEPADAGAETPRLSRALTFERVQFSYGSVETGSADGEDVVLSDLDLVIPAGRTTAIVGPSGAGKSTVADLAVGLLRPTSGVVAVDGVALEGSRLHAWRRQLGYVNQDTFLFNESIRENLRLVRPDATEGELRTALHDASATFVYALPDGLDTVVGDRGVRLSGGERQRIALARAIVREPTLLILDEATSALDPDNEQVIQEAIERMAGRLTILMIAHRLASVRRADVIYVMEAGCVVESGPWDDLVARPAGRFRALCEAQGLLSPTGDVRRASEVASGARV